jgi:hypothetical protein
MTIFRISLFAMISALFVVGGAGKGIADQAACLKHCGKKYCVYSTSGGGGGAGKCSAEYSSCANKCKAKNK